MSETFDPLHRWLGIPPEEQPPTHYRLLGLRPFETNPEVIEAACDQRMMYVRQAAIGKYAEQSQDVLNALSKARVCLLDSGQKAAYDESLKAKAKAAEAKRRPARALPLPASPPGAARADAAKAPAGDRDFPVAIQVSKPPRRKGNRPLTWIVAGVAACMMLVAAAIAVSYWRTTPPETIAKNDAAGPSKIQPHESPPPAKTPQNDPAPAPVGPAEPPTESADSRPPEPMPQPPAKSAASEKPKPAVEPETKPSPAESPPAPTPLPASENPPPTPAPMPTTKSPSSAEKPVAPPNDGLTRLPVPAEGEVKQAAARVREVFGERITKAKEPGEKVQLVEALLRSAAGSNSQPVDQYALLREAQQQATTLRDVALVMRALNELAMRFDIDGLAERVDAASVLARSAKTPAANAAASSACLDLIADLIDADRYDEASRLTGLAASSAGRSKHGHLASLTPYVEKRVKVLDREYKKVMPQVEIARATPADADANLAVGKFYCFAKGDWKRGLAYLKLGSDPSLRDLAERELAPGALQKQGVELADAWWKASTAASGEERAAAQRRAKHWYVMALPYLNGLAKADVEKKLSRMPSPRVQLQIRIDNYDGRDELHFLPDEMLWRHFEWNIPAVVVVNDMPWQVGPSPTLPNRGSMQFFPPDVDWGTIQVQKVRGRGSVTAAGEPGHAVVKLNDPFVGSDNYEFVVTFGRDGSPK